MKTAWVLRQMFELIVLKADPLGYERIIYFDWFFAVPSAAQVRSLGAGRAARPRHRLLPARGAAGGRGSPSRSSVPPGRAGPGQAEPSRAEPLRQPRSGHACPWGAPRPAGGRPRGGGGAAGPGRLVRPSISEGRASECGRVREIYIINLL